MSIVRVAVAVLAMSVVVAGCGSTLPSPRLDPEIPPGGMTPSAAVQRARELSMPSLGAEEVISIQAGHMALLNEGAGGGDPMRWIWRVAFHGAYERMHCAPLSDPPASCPPDMWKSVSIDYFTGAFVAADYSG